MVDKLFFYKPKLKEQKQREKHERLSRKREGNEGGFKVVEMP